MRASVIGILPASIDPSVGRETAVMMCSIFLPSHRRTGHHGAQCQLSRQGAWPGQCSPHGHSHAVTTAGLVGHIDLGLSAPGCSWCVAILSSAAAAGGRRFFSNGALWARSSFRSCCGPRASWSDRGFGSGEVLQHRLAVLGGLKWVTNPATGVFGGPAGEQEFHSLRDVGGVQG